MTPDFAALRDSARRCNAVYTMAPADALAEFKRLAVPGEVIVGQYKDPDHQAVLSRLPDGSFRLTISGTRFSDLVIADLIDDEDVRPLDLGDGVIVTTGGHRGCDKLWAWVLDQIPADAIVHVEGHSLGAWRTRYTPLFLAPARIGRLISLESPKGANAAYWAKYRPQLASLVSVINGRDFWAGYPVGLDMCHPPDPMVWITPTDPAGYRMATEAEWPGGTLEGLPDHGIGTSVEPHLAALATRFAAPASAPIDPAHQMNQRLGW